MPPEAPAPAITQMTVGELKKDPQENTEYVICFASTTKWGHGRKFTFLAPAGTHRIGQHVQVTFEVEPVKESTE